MLGNDASTTQITSGKKMLVPQNSMGIKKDRRVKRKNKSSSKKKASSINNQTLTED